MAPEMIQGESYSYPADVWSLGCVIYYLLMHQYPFGDNLFLFISKAQSGDVPQISNCYSNHLQSLPMLMLQPKPSDHSTVEDLFSQDYILPKPLIISKREKTLFLMLLMLPS